MHHRCRFYTLSRANGPTIPRPDFELNTRTAVAVTRNIVGRIRFTISMLKIDLFRPELVPACSRPFDGTAPPHTIVYGGLAS